MKKLLTKPADAPRKSHLNPCCQKIYNIQSMKTTDSHSLSPRALLQAKENPADPLKPIEIRSDGKLLVQV